MKELDQAIARMYGSPLSPANGSNGPTYQSIRQRIYRRHQSNRSSANQSIDSNKFQEQVLTEKESVSSEDNNNTQVGNRAIRNSAIAPGQRSASSGSISTATTVHLANGHHSLQNASRERPQCHLSPLLSGCRRKLNLQLQKALRGSKPRWTSPSNPDEKSKSKRRSFLRKKKSDPSPCGGVEDRPSSISGPSEDGFPAAPPPPLTRSPSAGQIEYLNLVPLQVALPKVQQLGQITESDEHRLIAYNSSLLMASTGPLQQPYQTDSANGVLSSSANSVENGAPNALENVKTVEPGLFEESNNGEMSSINSPMQTDQGATGASAELNNNSDRLNEEADVGPATNSGVVTLEEFRKTHNRTCTSFRIKVSLIKNPVDACLLPDDYTAIADYDNGLLILNAFGEVMQHKKSPHEINSCGVACSRSSDRLLLLVVRDGTWSINVYNYSFVLIETARCPTDPLIENWALRRLVVSLDARLHLLASGEHKSCIWTYELDKREWKTVLVENSGRKMGGNYNDMSVRYNLNTKETRILLCEWKKAQLWTLAVNDKGAVVEQRSIKMKRVKGQEWIVQGPHLATLDEYGDIVVYDGSGKLFLFDGDCYKCKKIIADVGRGEVSALAVADGWVYALCRYRLCFEAYLYREQNETNL